MRDVDQLSSSGRPFLADIDCRDGVVTVTVDPTATVASATVTVPEMAGGGFNQVVTNVGGRTTVFQGVGNVSFGQSVTGVTIVNGQVITGGVSGGMTAASPIEVHVTLPAGSGVRMRSYNANLTINGPLAALDLDTHNGTLRTGIVGRLKVHGHNGTTEVDAVTEWADIDTHNGNTYIGAYSGGAARFNGHNGTVELSATPLASGRIEARSHNGDIRLRGVSGRADLDVVTHTRNGHISKR